VTIALRRSTSLGCAALGAFLLLASPCRADGRASPAPSEAAVDDPLIAQGIDLRKRGLDAEALALFLRANEERPSARAVAQIALAEQALGRWVDAEASLLEALGHTDDPWIVRQRAYLEGSLAAVQGHLATLFVECNVPGAEVRIGGKPGGRTPLPVPVRVQAGETTLEIRAPGHAPWTRALALEGGSRVTQAFMFVEPPPAPPRILPQHVPLAVTQPGASPARRAGWVLAAGAGVLLLAGIAGVVTRELEAGIYDEDARCGPLPGHSRQDRCGTNRDIGSAAEGAAIAAFAGAGITAAASALLLFTGPGARGRAAEGGLGCRWMGAGIECGGSF
jgi:hypothetical protein